MNTRYYIGFLVFFILIIVSPYLYDPSVEPIELNQDGHPVSLSYDPQNNYEYSEFIEKNCELGQVYYDGIYVEKSDVLALKHFFLCTKSFGWVVSGSSGGRGGYYAPYKQFHPLILDVDYLNSTAEQAKELALNELKTLDLNEFWLDKKQKSIRARWAKILTLPSVFNTPVQLIMNILKLWGFTCLLIWVAGAFVKTRE